MSDHNQHNHPSATIDSNSNLQSATPTSNRRPFLKGSGFAMLAGIMAGPASAQSISIDNDISAQEAAHIQLVNDFCAAWSTMDLQNVTALMTDASLYRMTETTPAVTGARGLVDQMQPWVDSSHAIEFKILETFARGNIVINHRIDTFSSDTRPIIWEGVGVFLIKDGLIHEWSDYTMQLGPTPA